jgi:hypothetical protein
MLACHGRDPLLVDQKKIPGVYVMTGPDYTDELVFSGDGTIARTTTYKGERWTQTGHWTSRTVNSSRPSPNTVIEFTHIEPECSTGKAVASKPFPWAVPETPLCQRSRVAFICYDRERVSICFDEDLSYRFRRRGFFLPWLGG